MTETASRQAILDRLRTRTVDVPPLPDLDPAALVRFDDPLSQFCDVASAVGAAVHFVDHPNDVASVLEGLELYQQASAVASLLPEAVQGNVDIGSIEDPHDLKSLDWLVAEGEFGVAENGAIWVRTRGVRHRVSFFITQYLALVLDQNQIVQHMHAAYDRVESARRESGSGQNFGVFVAGPSKTADIEQSLVLGAHGCRALHVFLIRSGA